MKVFLSSIGMYPRMEIHPDGVMGNRWLRTGRNWAFPVAIAVSDYGDFTIPMSHICLVGLLHFKPASCPVTKLL
ncbi:hypothetical protein SRHO_G00021900 [Serrasalmus rhombeus]